MHATQDRQPPRRLPGGDGYDPAAVIAVREQDDDVAVREQGSGVAVREPEPPGYVIAFRDQCLAEIDKAGRRWADEDRIRQEEQEDYEGLIDPAVCARAAGRGS